MHKQKNRKLAIIFYLLLRSERENCSASTSGLQQGNLQRNLMFFNLRERRRDLRRPEEQERWRDLRILGGESFKLENFR